MKSVEPDCFDHCTNEDKSKAILCRNGGICQKFFHEKENLDCDCKSTGYTANFCSKPGRLEHLYQLISFGDLENIVEETPLH